jgi:RpiR family carbohydrate utilization transcriptional regulator
MSKRPDSQTILPPRGQRDLIDRLRSMTEDLPDAEQRVAQVILGDANWVTESAIKAVAERAAVSEPTVMRLCRKLGLDGFTAFKLRLAKDLVVANLYLSADRVVKEETPFSIAGHMYESVMQALRLAASTIDGPVLDEAAKDVVRAGQIFCFGVGGSSAVLAAEAENRLFRLGLSVQASADPYRQRMTAAIANSETLFLCISSTGKPQSVLESALLGRQNGARICAIAPRDSPLGRAAHITLPVEISGGEYFFNLPANMRYAQLFVVDCLAGAVAAKLGATAAENLKSIRAVLNAHHGATRQQPIGD